MFQRQGVYIQYSYLYMLMLKVKFSNKHKLYIYIYNMTYNTHNVLENIHDRNKRDVLIHLDSIVLEGK